MSCAEDNYIPCISLGCENPTIIKRALNDFVKKSIKYEAQDVNIKK